MNYFGPIYGIDFLNEKKPNENCRILNICFKIEFYWDESFFVLRKERISEMENEFNEFSSHTV